MKQGTQSDTGEGARVDSDQKTREVLGPDPLALRKRLNAFEEIGKSLEPLSHEDRAAVLRAVLIVSGFSNGSGEQK